MKSKTRNERRMRRRRAVEGAIFGALICIALCAPGLISAGLGAAGL